MKTRLLFALASAGVLAIGLVTVSWAAPADVKMITQKPAKKMTTPIPENITTPDKVETSIGTLKFFDGIPIGDTKDTVYDYMDRARAVQVYVDMIPAVSTYSLLRGNLDMGATASNQILIWEQLGDSKGLVLTYNNTSLYTWGFLHLDKDGPTVVEVPPDVLGVFDDGYMRYLSDFGAAGPDKGKGGKYLVLPPGYKGDVPEGYFVVKSTSNVVWNFMRGYVRGSVQDPANVKKAADNILNNLKVYPLSKKDNPPKTEFTNMTGKYYNTIPPNDFSYFERVNEIVQREPISFIEPETRGLIAAIGIVKGKPFKPDARMKKILNEAAETGVAMSRVIAFESRDKNAKVYPGKQWESPYITSNSTFYQGDYINLEARTAFHFTADGITPSMAARMPDGLGSRYQTTYKDKDGNFLDGNKTYKLHMPAGVPVKLFWAVTVYDTWTRCTMPTQPYPSISSQQKPAPTTNADGSIDIFFSNEKPADVSAANWVKTLPDQGLFVYMRYYGPLKAFHDKSWIPNDVELVK